MKNKDIDSINKWLDEEFGHDLLGRAHYRIIWSVGELEKRKGTSCCTVSNSNPRRDARETLSQYSSGLAVKSVPQYW